MQVRKGQRIRKTVGIRLFGTVLDRIPSRTEWSDGTYRYPERHERAVGVLWDDKTIGWISEMHISVDKE